jgi:hypothetical protein
VAVVIPLPRVTFGRYPRPHPVIVARGGLSGLGAASQVLPASTVQTIAGAIQQQEGYYPGSLAYQNNNPGNLIYVGQAGATPGAGGFAQFSSYDAGLSALENQIQLYAGRGLTIQGMMNVYAPSTQPGNNPGLYASNVAAALGVSPDTPLTSLDGAGAAVPDLVPTNVYTDSGVFSLDSMLSPAGVDPVLMGVGAAVLGVVLFSAFRN